MKIRRPWLICALVCVVMTGTTGCYDREELEQQAFVTVMGVDRAPDGMIDCTIRIATPTNTASSGGGGGAAQPLAATGPITVRGKSVTQALMIANTSVERTITLSHLTSVVFGQKIAREGLQPVIQTFVREQQFRRTVFVSVAKGTAKEVLQSDQPMLEHSPGRTADSLYVVGNRVGLFPVIQLHGLVTEMEQPHQDTVLPVYAVNESVKSDPKGQDKLTQTKVSTEPGQVARSGGNPVEWEGGAVFHGDKLVDMLSGQEVMYLRMLRGSLKSTRMEFQLPGKSRVDKSRRTVGLYVRKEHGPSVSISMTQPMKVRIEVPLDADLTSESDLVEGSILQREANVSNVVSHEMEASMKKLLDKLYKKDDVDPIPLSNHIRGRFRTYPQFAEFPWEKRMKNAEFDVQVRLQIRRIGQRTQPVRNA